MIALATPTLRSATMVLVGLGIGVTAGACAAHGSLAARLLQVHAEAIDAKLRRLHLAEVGRRLVAAQGIAIVALGAVAAATERAELALIVLAVALGPTVGLRWKQASRTALLEAQVDGLLVALANALKSVPSPAGAIDATASILPQPIRQEIEHLLKEVHLGSTLEQALLVASSRMGSRTIDVALSALSVGLRVGGDLPAVLERTAATIREMNRLAGVFRSKTAASRAQILVLGAIPPGIVGAFGAVQPGYFDPLVQLPVGQAVALGVTLTWLGAIGLARLIMAVEL